MRFRENFAECVTEQRLFDSMDEWRKGRMGIRWTIKKLMGNSGIQE